MVVSPFRDGRETQNSVSSPVDCAGQLLFQPMPAVFASLLLVQIVLPYDARGPRVLGDFLKPFHGFVGGVLEGLSPNHRTVDTCAGYPGYLDTSGWGAGFGQYRQIVEWDRRREVGH